MKYTVILTIDLPEMELNFARNYMEGLLFVNAHQELYNSLESGEDNNSIVEQMKQIDSAEVTTVMKSPQEGEQVYTAISKDEAAESFAKAIANDNAISVTPEYKRCVLINLLAATIISILSYFLWFR